MIITFINPDSIPKKTYEWCAFLLETRHPL